MLKPTAPPLDASDAPASKPQSAHAPIVATEPLPPSVTEKGGHIWLTLKLIPYHVLNFVLGTAAFCVVLPGVLVCAMLMPFCLIGIPVYLLLLQLVRMMVVADVALANTITRSQAAIHWNVPDEIDETSAIAYELRLAPKLARISFRSTIVLLYFLSIKLVYSIISIIAVSLPLLPIVCELVADFASDTVNTSLAGWNVKEFNFGTNPFMYFLTCIAFFIGGVFLMHVFGRVSRETTRRVCCQEIKPNSTTTSAV